MTPGGVLSEDEGVHNLNPDRSTNQAMSPLRRRMIEDMSIRKFAPGTQYTYVRFVKRFSIFSAGHPIRRPSRIAGDTRCRNGPSSGA